MRQYFAERSAKDAAILNEMGLMKKKVSARKELRPQALYVSSGHPIILYRGRDLAPGSKIEARGFI